MLPFQQKAAAARKFAPKAAQNLVKPALGAGKSLAPAQPVAPVVVPAAIAVTILPPPTVSPVQPGPGNRDLASSSSAVNNIAPDSDTGKLVVGPAVPEAADPVVSVQAAPAIVDAPDPTVQEPVRKKFRVNPHKPAVKRSSLLDVSHGSDASVRGTPPPGSWPGPPIPPESENTPAPSVLPVEIYGPNCPSELYTVYLRKQPEGLGIVLKNIEDRPVVVGFAPSFLAVQVESQARKLRLFDVIVGVNNVDIRTSVAAQPGKGRGKRGARVMRNGRPCREQASSFDKIVAALRESVTPNTNNVNSYGSSSNHANNISISLSTIDTDIVCITLARPVAAAANFNSGNTQK